MKKLKILFLVLTVGLLLPKLVYAESDNTKFVKVSEKTKYYKTIIMDEHNTENKKNLINSNEAKTVEITEKEYNSVDDNSHNAKGPGVTNTDYKKLTTEIYSNGSYYRYKATLDWKTMPSTRSYDVIGIGNLTNVVYLGNMSFSQYYCISGGSCHTTTSYYSKSSSTGSGAAFKLPTGNLSVMSQTFSFDVRKNTASTINYQAAYGDYSHAITSVTSTQAQNYSIGTSGIVFSGGIGSYYDNIMPAVATWNGSW